jgi:hypothetical protein
LNGFVREERMKHLFVLEYRAAEAHGEHNLKVLLKLGHSLGDLVTEFATANGTDAYTVGVYLRGLWRDVKTQQGLRPVELATDPNAWTIIDFRSLRPGVAAGQFGMLNAKLLVQINGFVAALIPGGASAGGDSLLTDTRPY